MKIANNLTTWLAIPPLLAIALGGITKGWDTLKYDIIGQAKNDDEVYIRHMIADHLQTSEETKTTAIPIDGGGYLIVNIYKDKCGVVKRETADGIITKNTVLPDPGRVDKIKEMYSSSGNIAYAGEMQFSLGYHKKDFDFNEKGRGNVRLRIYGDGCKLSYEYDDYGNTKEWRWLNYQHRSKT